MCYLTILHIPPERISKILHILPVQDAITHYWQNVYKDITHFASYRYHKLLHIPPVQDTVRYYTFRLQKIPQDITGRLCIKTYFLLLNKPWTHSLHGTCRWVQLNHSISATLSYSVVLPPRWTFSKTVQNRNTNGFSSFILSIDPKFFVNKRN